MFRVTVRGVLVVNRGLVGAAARSPKRPRIVQLSVDATFCRDILSGDNTVVDIEQAEQELGSVLGELDHRNAGTVPVFVGGNTSSELLAAVIADRLADRVRSGSLGESGLGLAGITITLHESDLASASFEQAL